MGITRRRAIKGMLATTVGAFAGTGVYGVAYERHHIGVTSAVQLLMTERPDLIVLGGDYVTWGERAYVQPVAELLAPLSAPYGVFAILGNHDDDRDMPAALTARKFTVLKDQRTRITVRGAPLEIAGI